MFCDHRNHLAPDFSRVFLAVGPKASLTMNPVIKNDNRVSIIDKTQLLHCHALVEVARLGNVSVAHHEAKHYLF